MMIIERECSISFDLNPSCVYAWQAKDSDLSLPAQRGNVLTVAGLMKTDNSFEGYSHKGSMNQDLFIAYLEDFIEKESKEKQ